MGRYPADWRPPLLEVLAHRAEGERGNPLTIAGAVRRKDHIVATCRSSLKTTFRIPIGGSLTVFATTATMTNMQPVTKAQSGARFRKTTESFTPGAKTLPQRYFVSPGLFNQEQENIF